MMPTGLVRRGAPALATLLMAVLALAACGSSLMSTTAAGSAATAAATAAATMTHEATPMATMTEGTPMAAMGPAQVMLHNDAMYGPILTDGHGMTLYVFTRDSGGASACTSTCATTWPPLLTKGTPTAASGVTGPLGTINRADGSMQVTYLGHPLYTYSRDSGMGDTKGQGVGGVWFVATPSGMATPAS